MLIAHGVFYYALTTGVIVLLETDPELDVVDLENDCTFVLACLFLNLFVYHRDPSEIMLLQIRHELILVLSILDNLNVLNSPFHHSLSYFTCLAYSSAFFDTFLEI